MNALEEAAEVLSLNLKFGDSQQIHAVNLLAQVEECLAAIGACRHEENKQCPRCGGEGRLDCVCPECEDTHTRECPKCEGSGEGGEPRACGQCMKPFSKTVLEMACAVNENGWPKKLQLAGSNQSLRRCL
jgi:DnaJ-class molecular chaperone